MAALRLRLQQPLLAEDVAARAITDASALVRAVARQDFDAVTGDQVTLPGGGREITLPQRPVTAVTAVVELAEVGDQEYPATEGTHYRRVDDRLIKPRPPRLQPGMVPAQSVTWSRPWACGLWAPWVKVTYSHGYATPPPWLTTIVLDAAVVYATNPQGLRSETVGAESWTWATESLQAPTALLDTIKARLAAAGARRGGAFSIG